MHVYALLFDCRLVHLGVNLQLAKGSLQRSLRKLKGHPPRKPMGPEAPTPTSTRAQIYKGQPKHKRHSTRARTLIAQQRKPVSRQMKRRQRKAQRGTWSAVSWTQTTGGTRHKLREMGQSSDETQTTIHRSTIGETKNSQETISPRTETAR